MAVLDWVYKVLELAYQDLEPLCKGNKLGCKDYSKLGLYMDKVCRVLELGYKVYKALWLDQLKDYKALVRVFKDRKLVCRAFKELCKDITQACLA